VTQIAKRSLLSWQTLIPAGILLFVWICLLAWSLTATAYYDHQDLLGRIRTLNSELENNIGELKQARGRINDLETENAALRPEIIRLRQQIDDRVRRRQWSATLATFVTEGNRLMERCNDETVPPPEAEAEAWASRVEEFLVENFGQGYVARFRNGAGLPAGVTTIRSIPHRQLWGGLRVRMARLNEFITELRLNVDRLAKGERVLIVSSLSSSSFGKVTTA